MYLALYRKWRPKLFNDVIAQEHIANTLKNEVKFNKITHAYLFTGPKGTGKTSCARIFSKALNCLNNVDGEPCCSCESCLGIENGTILDVVEMDGASSNSVNDIKILKDEASFVPSFCKFKIYIIDEAHMLSTSAFNALLKIIEEPPKHVIFILATTEIKKILETIVSRCQRFDFKRINIFDIEFCLDKISKLEKINLSDDAKSKIASLANGSMRDAIAFLDECFAVSSNIDLELINKIFGLADETKVLEIFEAVSKYESFNALRIVDDIYENGEDLQNFCGEFIKFCREIVMCKVFDKHVCSTFSKKVFDKILMFSKKFNLKFLTEILNESLSCLENLKTSLNIKLKFELFILSLCFKFKEFFGMTRKNSVNNSNINLLDKKNNSNFNVDYANTKDNFVKKFKKTTNSQISSDLKLEPLQNWSLILNDLKINLNNEMLTGFLIDSEAFVSGDRLYINFKNPIVSKKVLERSTEISKIIKEKTGKQYRIFVKKSKIKNDDQNLNNLNLNSFLDIAKDLKIEIDEKK